MRSAAVSARRPMRVARSSTMIDMVFLAIGRTKITRSLAVGAQLPLRSLVCRMMHQYRQSRCPDDFVRDAAHHESRQATPAMGFQGNAVDTPSGCLLQDRGRGLFMHLNLCG